MTTPPDTDDVPAPADPERRPAARARARRPALFALVAAATGLAAAAVGFAVAVGGDETRDAAAPDVEGPRAPTLGEDDCFTDFRQAGAKVFARSAPCTSSHQGEVVAKPVLPILEYPGDQKLAAEGQKACRVQASSLYAAGRGDEFAMFVARPDQKAWESGERAVTCLLRYTGGPRNSRLEKRWGPLSLLVAGDCVGTWSYTGEVDVVDCTAKHEAQIFAKLTLENEKNLDEKEVYARCGERARAVFGSKPPAHLLLRVGGPNRREWAGGEKYALCLLLGKDDPLTRSVIPG